MPFILPPSLTTEGGGERVTPMVYSDDTKTKHIFQGQGLKTPYLLVETYEPSGGVKQCNYLPVLKKNNDERM